MDDPARGAARGNAVIDAPHIQLRTTSRSENVAVVRELLEGLAATLALDRDRADDIKTAVSEACNNVVLHAYEGGEGPMELDVTVRRRELELVIRDRGTGIRPHVDAAEAGLHGVGLAVIQAYADRVEFRGQRAVGTEVRMTFALGEDAPPAFSSATEGRTPTSADGEVVVAVRGPELLLSVLARVTATLAVRARFTVDRLSDAQLVADTVAAAAAVVALEDEIVFTLDSAPRELVLRIGPLRRGGARTFVQVGPAGLEPVLGHLCDEVDVVSDVRGPSANGGECVRVRILDQR